MPIYEFYCRKATPLNFFSGALTGRQSLLSPLQKVKLQRRCRSSRRSLREATMPRQKTCPASTSRKWKSDGDDRQGIGGLDENDPRQAAQLMRKLTERRGSPRAEDEEPCRMEKGEDRKRSRKRWATASAR